MVFISNNANAIEISLGIKESIANITKLHCEFDHSKTRYWRPERVKEDKELEEFSDFMSSFVKKRLQGYQVTTSTLWTRLAHTFFSINSLYWDKFDEPSEIICGLSLADSDECNKYYSRFDDWEMTKTLNMITNDSGNSLYGEESILVKYKVHPIHHYSKSDIDKVNFDKHFSNYVIFKSMENMISRKNGSFIMDVTVAAADRDRDIRAKFPNTIEKRWNVYLILEGTCSIDESKRLF